MPLKKKKKKVSQKKVVKRIKRTKRKVIKVIKKRLRKRLTPKTAVAKKPKEDIVGVVTHYFPKVRAAVIKLKAPLAIGGVVKIKGHTTDFTQNVTSIQIDHVPVNQAKKGQEIGVLVDSRVRQHDIVYKA